ncbi:MAG: hypothetical protein AMXMBFR6_25000 [Betaproteobacteria bacterium]
MVTPAAYRSVLGHITTGSASEDHSAKHYPEHLRRIRYRDPQTGKTQLMFPTNHVTLPALRITALYKSRWQAEPQDLTRQAWCQANRHTPPWIKRGPRCPRPRSRWICAMPPSPRGERSDDAAVQVHSLL